MYSPFMGLWQGTQIPPLRVEVCERGSSWLPAGGWLGPLFRSAVLHLEPWPRSLTLTLKKKNSVLVREIPYQTLTLILTLIDFDRDPLTLTLKKKVV